MKQVVIENPVINSPYREPTRHFQFTEDGITNHIVEARRLSSYFIPVPRPKKRGQRLLPDTQWTEDRLQEKLCRRRHGFLGTETSPDPGGHGRRDLLRQERPPRLHHPLHLQRRGALLHPGLPRPPRRRPRPTDPLNLILEVTGDKDKKKAAKVATARTLWVPGVNNYGAFGRWAFLEIKDPWDAQNVVRAFLRSLPVNSYA